VVRDPARVCALGASLVLDFVVEPPFLRLAGGDLHAAARADVGRRCGTAIPCVSHRACLLSLFGAPPETSGVDQRPTTCSSGKIIITNEYFLANDFSTNKKTLPRFNRKRVFGK
jgi:hypothetical protein